MNKLISFATLCATVAIAKKNGGSKNGSITTTNAATPTDPTAITQTSPAAVTAYPKHTEGDSHSKNQHDSLGTKTGAGKTHVDSCETKTPGSDGVEKTGCKSLNG